MTWAAKAQKEKMPEHIFIFSKDAPVYNKPNGKAELMITMAKGQKVKVLEQKGIWYKIQLNKKTGWISKYLTSTQKPGKKNITADVMKINLKKQARKRASAYATAASARALTKKGKIPEAIDSDIRAIKRMEEFDVTDKEILEFINQGKKRKK